jgi:DNA repair protein RecN (Recombination protein N)
MILDFTLSNFTVVESLGMEATPGFNVITGETGAGKSLLFDAIALCTGGRADNSKIRQGEKNATVSVRFDVSQNDDATTWLENNGFPSEDKSCILKRVVSDNGRSKAFINGHPCSVANTKELGSMLVSLCGQHEHYSLLDASKQRSVLDKHGRLSPLTEKVNEHYVEWRTAKSDLDDLIAKKEEREDRLQLLRYQHGELETFAPEQGEYENLEDELSKLSHVEDLKTLGYTQIQRLRENEDMSVLGNLNASKRDIEAMVDMDNTLSEVLECISSAVIEIEEATNELQNYLDRAESDPQRLQQVESRYSEYRELARKHRTEPNQLAEVWLSLSNELKTLEQADENAELLTEKVEILHSQLKESCLTLHDARKESAYSLAETLTHHMQELGMEGGECAFNVMFDESKIGPNGADTVALMIRTNPGENMGLLSKVASGGELSRVSLILQLTLAKRERTNTLLFDEVDVGISGKTAGTVGDMLKSLGKHAQIFSITHLPQVAGYGDNHYLVKKEQVRGRTQSTMTMLDLDGRIEHIAELLSNDEPDETARNQAKKLIK